MKTLQHFWNFIAQTKSAMAQTNNKECNYTNNYYGDQICKPKG